MKLPRCDASMSIEERLIAKVKITDGCWIWQGKPNDAGYGHVTINKKTFKAHRLAYETWVGPIPEHKPHVCHHCDVPACINPEHLFPGTPKDNMQDKMKKGRAVGWQKDKTHCKHGHEFNEENTRIQKNKRQCKICSNRNALKSYHRNKETK